MAITLPSSAQPIVGDRGLATPAFYRFFGALAQSAQAASGAATAAELAALSARVDALTMGFAVRGLESVLTTGSAATGLVTVQLVNDAAAPGNTYVYGTGPTGLKGWHTLASALAHTADITLSVATTGVITVGLSAIADAGGGTLQKTAFDGNGRKTGTSAATTSDLTEGSNLYFTNARVLETTLTGLSTATSAPVVATDSVLVGIGKLQAQVNTNATAIAGKEPAIAAGTTAQYWRGDKSWRDFATDVRAAVLTGLSTATSAVIAATDTVLGALGKLQAQITDNLLPQGYIDGLKMVWVSGTALTVTTGAAYIPSLGKVLRVTSDIPKTGLSLTASTWYHVYLYSNAGTPDVDISTTGPASPYNGTARCKTGDTTRRYVGSARADASGNLLKFMHSSSGGYVIYLVDINNAQLLILSGGAALSEATVSAATAVPVTSRLLRSFSENAGSTDNAYISNADAGTPPNSHILSFLRASKQMFLPIALTASQNFTYLVGGSSTLSVWATGYDYER